MNITIPKLDRVLEQSLQSSEEDCDVIALEMVKAIIEKITAKCKEKNEGASALQLFAVDHEMKPGQILHYLGPYCIGFIHVYKYDVDSPSGTQWRMSITYDPDQKNFK